MFDTFISYRRDGGQNTAESLRQVLEYKDYKPFLDLSDMHAGRFDEQIHLHIRKAVNFILILSKGALDRCAEPNDWVHKEILTAIETGKNIVIMMEEGFTAPENLSDDISSILNCQSVIYHQSNLNQKLDELFSMLKRPDEEHLRRSIWSRHKTVKIGGNYITEYEDSEKGCIVIRKAPAKLHRIFNKITGITSFGSNQEWKIRGKLYRKTRFVGTYCAKDVFDQGFGTFFLDMTANGVWEGFWCGYDNVNKTITSGRYKFTKRYDNYRIRNIAETDFSSVIHISNQQLGESYLSEEMLKNAVNPDNTMSCLVAEDNISGQILGFCFFDIINTGQVNEICRGKEISEFRLCSQIGYIKTVAVEEMFTGHGIASSLVKESMDIVRRKDVRCFISTAWKFAGEINIGSVLINNGFTKRFEIENYWYEDSIKYGFSCPQCGHPCKCTCAIYTTY